MTNESIQLIKEKRTLIKKQKTFLCWYGRKEYKIYLNYAYYNHELD